MTVGLLRVERWVCDECGLTFILDLEPATRCASHGDDEHCHTGHRIICHDGKVIYAASRTDCQPFSTADYE